MTEEMVVQTKLDREALSKVLEKLDIDRLMRFLIEMLAMLGELSVKLAEIEKEHKDIPEFMKIISANPKLFLGMIIEKASAEEVKTLMRALLRIDELSPKLSNLFNLKSEEKKKIGEELIKLSKEIGEAYKKAREKG